MPTPLSISLPYFTAALPGVGGAIKRLPEDFFVEELPLYDPLGEGEHLFLWVEKRELSAEMLTRHIAATLGIARADVGVAGLKDRQAVTRQFVSVPAASLDRIAAIESTRVHVLNVMRHNNKLRTGHLRGNRFDVAIRETVPDPLARAAPIANIIRHQGFPNFYGEQRFGVGGETLTLGLDLLSGRKTERDIPRGRRKFLLRLALSSVQSAIFNEVLRRRIEDGLLHQVLPGDVMQVQASGGPFVAEDVPREQERFDIGETVISGPMYGLKMRHPTAEAAERERVVLADLGVSPANFGGWRKLLPGTRRPFLSRVDELELATEADGLRLRFTLDRGTYATILLREFIKEDAGSADDSCETD